jgi:hypothetical protein
MHTNRLRSVLGEFRVRVYWERIGLLGRIYGLVGQGFKDQEIADKPNITIPGFATCISWMLKRGSI